MSDQFPLVTVIVPVYNVALYLERCLQSIIQQTYQNLQIIIIDDGSTDESGRICDRFAGIDKRIRVYHTSNRGLVAARKYGLDVAKGKYIGFVDGDDYIENIMYEKLVENIVDTDADFVHTGHIVEERGKRTVITVPTKVISLIQYDKKIEEIERFILDKKDGYFIIPSIWSKLFKGEFIKQNYMLVPDEQQYGEDVLCLFHCILHSTKISLLSQEFYYYVIREKSISHLDNFSIVWQEIRLLYHMSAACNMYKDYSEKLKDNIFDWIKQRLMRIVEMGVKDEIRIPRCYYPNIEQLHGKKIILYGAGDVGKDFYMQISHYQYCEIIAWVDRRYKEIELGYAKVDDINVINSSNYDYVLVAVENESIVSKIIENLIRMGIEEEKVLWELPIRY